MTQGTRSRPELTPRPSIGPVVAWALARCHDAVIVLDGAGLVCLWNPAAEALYGWNSDEALGRRAAELYFSEPAGESEAARVTVAEGQWEGELRQRTTAGRELIVGARRLMLPTEAGYGDGATLLLVSDRSELSALRAQAPRLHRLATAGTLAGGVAHSLRNAMQPILTVVGLLKSHLTGLSPREEEWLGSVETGVRRSAEMVRRLVDYTRGPDGQRQELPPRRVIDEVMVVARELFPEGVELTVAVEPNLPLVVAEPADLHQILLNLLVNARDALVGRERGRMLLGARCLRVDAQYASAHRDAREGEYVVFEVKDTGVGMSAEVRARLFEPFFTTKGAGRGEGLGLVASREIVLTLGGFLTVKSAPEQGTVVQVWVPAATATARAERPSQESPPRGRGELVLVVDDDAAVREASERTLDAFGYRVITAGDGAEAVAAFTRNRGRVAAVVMDLMMPVMDGPTAIRALRALDPKVKVVVATAHLDRDALDALTGIDVAYRIEKPFDATALLRVLDDALRSIS